MTNLAEQLIPLLANKQGMSLEEVHTSLENGGIDIDPINLYEDVIELAEDKLINFYGDFGFGSIVGLNHSYLEKELLKPYAKWSLYSLEELSEDFEIPTHLFADPMKYYYIEKIFGSMNTEYRFEAIRYLGDRSSTCTQLAERMLKDYPESGKDKKTIAREFLKTLGNLSLEGLVRPAEDLWTLTFLGQSMVLFANKFREYSRAHHPISELLGRSYQDRYGINSCYKAVRILQTVGEYPNISDKDLRNKVGILPSTGLLDHVQRMSKNNLMLKKSTHGKSTIVQNKQLCEILIGNDAKIVPQITSRSREVALRCKWPQSALKVAEIIEDKCSATVAEIEEKTNLVHSTIWQVLHELQEIQMITILNSRNKITSHVATAKGLTAIKEIIEPVFRMAFSHYLHQFDPVNLSQFQ